MSSSASATPCGTSLWASTSSLSGEPARTAPVGAPAAQAVSSKPGKHPITSHGFKDAVADPQKVTTFLKSGNNYGMVWPEGGRIVFIRDLDGDDWRSV